MEQVADQVSKTKGKRTNFPWTEAREFTFVNYIYKEKGHLRTDTNMIDKFNNISLKLRVDSAFAGREFLDGAALKKKWDRISAIVDAKYSISEEGSNLSALEEEPSDLDKLVLDLLKERFETKKAKEEQAVKDKIRNDKMLTHEKYMLQRQDKSSDEVLVVDEDISDCSEEGSTSTKRRKVSKDKGSPPEMFEFEKEVINALKEDPRIIDIEVAERRQKLDDAAAEKIYARDLEHKRMEAEERLATLRTNADLEKSKAEVERSRADQAIAAAQLRMMELFSKHLSKE